MGTMHSKPSEQALPTEVVIEALRLITGKAVNDESFAEELERALGDEQSCKQLVSQIHTGLEKVKGPVKPTEFQPSTLKVYEWQWNDALQVMAEDDGDAYSADPSVAAWSSRPKYVYLPHHVLSVNHRVSPRELGFGDIVSAPYAPSVHWTRVQSIVKSALSHADRKRHWRFVDFLRSHSSSRLPTAILQPSSDEAGKVALVLGKVAYDFIYLVDAHALYLVFSSHKKHRISLDADPRKLFEVVVSELDGQTEVAEAALESIQKAFPPPDHDVSATF